MSPQNRFQTARNGACLVQSQGTCSGKGVQGTSPAGVQGGSPWLPLFPKRFVENALGGKRVLKKEDGEDDTSWDETQSCRCYVTTTWDIGTQTLVFAIVDEVDKMGNVGDIR